MANRRTGLPAFDLPGLGPDSAASFSRSSLSLVPAEWLLVRYRRRAHFIHLSATPSLAGDDHGLLLRTDSGHFAGTGATGGVRHFPGRHRKLPVSPWPLCPTWRLSVFPWPRGQAPDRRLHRALLS